MMIFAMHQLVDDPVRAPDPAVFLLILLVIPMVTWFSVRRKKKLGPIALTFALVSTAYVITRVATTVKGGGYLNFGGPDYFYLSLAFAAGSSPWIAARLAYTRYRCRNSVK
jgi:hypothetical protein